MRNPKSLFIFIALSVYPLGPLAHALEYPELNVVPRASDRLKMEAKKENNKIFNSLLPLQVSALSTLTAALIHQSNRDEIKDPDGQSTLMGYIAGGGWLVASLILEMTYHPYRSGLKEIDPLPTGSDREKLTKERLAEENIRHTARLGKRLVALSVLTQAGASIYMFTRAENRSIAEATSLAALGASIVPIIFPLRWQIIHREHQEYKKKIYGPIARLHPIWSSASNQNKTQKLGTGLGLTLEF